MITIRERLDEFEKFIAEEIKSADCGDCVTELKHFFAAQLEDVYKEIIELHVKTVEEIDKVISVPTLDDNREKEEIIAPRD